MHHRTPDAGWRDALYNLPTHFAIWSPPPADLWSLEGPEVAENFLPQSCASLMPFWAPHLLNCRDHFQIPSSNRVTSKAAHWSRIVARVQGASSSAAQTHAAGQLGCSKTSLPLSDRRQGGRSGRLYRKLRACQWRGSCTGEQES